MWGSSWMVTSLVHSLVASSSSSSSSTSSSSSSWLRILQINDVYDLDRFPHLYTLAQHYRNHHDNNNNNNNNNHNNRRPDRCILVCCGDFLSPSLLSSLDQGAAMVDLLNAVGCDFVCVGNHEADVGNLALKQRIQQSQFTWITTNIPDFSPQLQLFDDSDKVNNNNKVKTHEILQVGKRQVALLGFLTDDPALYRPTSFGGATILPIAESLTEWKDRLLLPTKSSPVIDLIVPMTHQSIQEDRTLAAAMAAAVQDKKKKTQIPIPLILGGHDHEIFLETVEGTTTQIVKTGMDAQHVAVIDILWNDNDDNNDHDTNDGNIQTTTTVPSPPTVTVTMVDTLDFEPHPDIQRRVQGHKSILRELETAKLFKISDWLPANKDNNSGTVVYHFSTHNNRLGPSTGTTALCSMLRMGLRCQVALLNAGCVRANKDYARDTYFTWSDLKAELVFSTKMVVANLPGKVLQETLRYSRRFAKEGIAFGGYLHTSRTTILSEDDDDDDNDTTIESIMGEPFDPERNYLTAFPYVLLEGLDDQKPLLEWAATPEAQPYLPSHHTAIPAKIVLVECMAALFWLQCARSFQDMAQEDGKIGPEDVRQKIRDLYGNQNNDVAADLMADSAFLLADRDGDGTISAMEQMIVRFVAMDMMNHIVTEEELQILRTIASQVLESDANDHDTLDRAVQEIRAALDLQGTGSIQREEILQALGQVAGKDFLQ